MKIPSRVTDLFCLLGSCLLIFSVLSRYGSVILSILAPFVTAWILSAFLYAPSAYLADTFSVSIKITCVFTVVTFFAALFSFVYIAAARLIREAVGFSSEIRSCLEALYDRFDSLSDTARRVLAFIPLPEKMPNYVEKLLSALAEKITAVLSAFAAQTVPSLFLSLPRVLISLGVAFLAVCFFISEKEAIVRFAADKLSERRRYFLSSVGKTLCDTATQYGKAYGTIAVVTFCELFSGLLLIRREYALLSALLITLIDILPVFGCGTVLVPWSIIEWINGSRTVASELLILFVFISVVRQWLEPRIVGSAVGLSPLAALFFLYAGGKVLGVAGLFLLPFTAVIVKNLYEKGLFPHRTSSHGGKSKTLSEKREKYRKYKRQNS